MLTHNSLTLHEYQVSKRARVRHVIHSAPDIVHNTVRVGGAGSNADVVSFFVPSPFGTAIGLCNASQIRTHGFPKFQEVKTRRGESRATVEYLILERRR